MIICVCVDDAFGMSFNRRRQSRDKAQILRLIETAGDRKIFVSEYSLPLFSETGAENVRLTRDFSEAGADDVCFFELEHVTEHAHKAESYILYRWNRKYPSDKKFPFDLAKKGYTLTRSTDFSGSSHEKITEEVWKKI